MENASYIALSRQMVLRREMEIIAHNMANADTPAFKGEDTVFVEYLSRTDDGERLSFVQDFGSYRNTAEGPLTETGGSLDFAIHGDGYFAVQTPQGERYTRVGRFQLDGEGQLVTSRGDPVLDSAGAPLLVPAEDGEITVARDGTVSTRGGPIGRISVVRFADEQAMEREAGGLYATGAPPQPAPEAQVVQGMVEGSNIEPVLELTRMIEVLRNYQSTQRLLDGEHERQRRAITTITGSSSA